MIGAAVSNISHVVVGVRRDKATVTLSGTAIRPLALTASASDLRRLAAHMARCGVPQQHRTFAIKENVRWRLHHASCVLNTYLVHLVSSRPVMTALESAAAWRVTARLTIEPRSDGTSLAMVTSAYNGLRTHGGKERCSNGARVR